MAIKNWEIVIDRQTKPISQAGFGKPLVLTTEKDFSFKTFNDVDDIIEDFEVGSETYRLVSRIKGQTPSPSEFAILGVETEDALELVTALMEENGEFYFLTCTSHEAEVVEALAEWTETQHKMYGFSTDDLELAESISSKQYDNTFYMVHKDPNSYPCEGWIGACAPFDAGSITWNYKEVSGVTTSDVDVNDVIDLNGNVIINQHGINHTHDGRVASGEWIDVIRSSHYLYARIDESVFGTLIRAPKVPYDNGGISMIEAAIEAPIKQAAGRGMVAEEDGEFLYEVRAPKRSETTQNDRAERTLPDIVAEVTLAGAIHGGKIQIVIKV